MGGNCERGLIGCGAKTVSGLVAEAEAEAVVVEGGGRRDNGCGGAGCE